MDRHLSHTPAPTVAGRRERPVGRSTRLPLIAREQMLRQIAHAFAEVQQGARIVVSIVGERGSGRSRVLRDLRTLPELAEALIIDVRPAAAPDLAGALSVALHETLLVRRSIGPMGVAALSEATGGASAEVAALASCAAVMPLVLLVDDIDRRAGAVVELGEILGSIAAPWLVVVSAERSGAAAATIVGRTTDARTLELFCEQFDHESVAALLRSLLAEEPDPGDVAWLHERTHGLPLLLREAIEAAVRCGALVRDGERLRRTGEIARSADGLATLLPLTVPELSRLPTAERTALATCALLGQRAPASMLFELDVDPASIERLVDRRLIVRDGASIGFASRLVHEAALAEACAAGLDERHAAALSRLVPPAIDEGLRPAVATIDRLLGTAAGDVERRELAAKLLGSAARLAAHNEYYYAAVLLRACYDTAIEHVADPIRIGEWFEVNVAVLFALGRVEEQRRVIDAFLQRYPATSAPTELLPVVARAMLWRVEFLERSKLAEPALAVLDAVDAVIARVDDATLAAGLAARVLMGRARIYGVIDRNDDALALLRRLLDELDVEAQLPIAFDAVLAFGRVARTQEQREEAERRIVAMLERFEREGRERLATQMRAALLGLHTADDDFDRFEPEILALLEQTRRCSLPRTETNAWVWLSIILSERGNHAAAIQAIDRAIEARWRIGSIALWQIAMITRAQMLMLARRDADALATIEHVERDAGMYGRPCRRFLIEIVRCIIAVRRGEWQGGAAALAEIARIGQEEGFDGVEQTVLEAEGEILLHTHAIEREQARDYARRVLSEERASLGARRLLAVALAVVARAHDDAGSAARGRSGASDPLLQELRRRVTESLSLWLERNAEANAAHALLLLRAHAPRAFASGDLATIDATLPPALEAPSWQHCDVQTLGTMRVIDAAGNERGGRHFGQHKSDSKPKKMLAALAVAAIVGRRLKRERLIDMVWGESVAADAAVNNFHVTLSGLRQVVGDVVDFDGTSYMLNTSLVRVDALQLVALVDEAAGFQRAGLIVRAYSLLRRAMTLVGGEFLDGIYDEWTDGAREIVRSKTRFARLRIAEIAMARGELDVARHQVGALLDADALDEEAELLHLALMRADGERLRALREYDRFAGRLATDYGTSPSLRLRELREAIAADSHVV